MQAALSQQTVAIEGVETDKYGRTVAFVYREGRNIEEALLEQGLAWVYDKYCLLPVCARYREIERTCRENRIGLWADDNPMPPWEWRQQKRDARQSR